MKTWVKLYTEINHDPKMGSLTWAQRGIWSGLLALAGEIDARDEEDVETGQLDSVEYAAWRLRCDLTEFTEAVHVFIEKGMIKLKDDLLYITHYAERQSRAPSDSREKVRERVSRHRKQSCNESVTTCNESVTTSKRGVTSTDTDTDTDTDTISLRDIAAEAANLPPVGGGADAPSPTDPPKPDIDWPDLNELAPSEPVPEPVKPKSTRKRSSPPREPPPPAVKVFHDNTQRYPAKALWPDIDTAIGRDPPSLERWERVVKAWLGMGWKSNNVNGMLDFFRRNEIPPGNGSGKHEHDTRRNTTSTGRHTQANWARSDGHTAEDIERIVAERQARGRPG